MHRVLVVLAICAASAAPAQSNDPRPNPAPQGESPQRSAPVLVDSVVATVNDSPILLSELRTLMAPDLRMAEQKEGKVAPELRRHIEGINLRKLLDKRRMAQAARTFGDLPPEQVELWLRGEVEREKKTQLREFGSYPAFGRELARQGRSWVTYEEDLRIEKMSELAEEIAVFSRLQRQTSLLVTPRMLRDEYAKNRDAFVHSAAATVTLVRFTGQNAQQQAEAAAAEWRQKDVPAREIAARYEDAVPIARVNAAMLTAELAPIAEFALAGPKGNVSGPITVAGRVHVARILEFAPARAGRFEDPEVQARLRDHCVRRVQQEFMDQAYERARKRTEVWVSQRPQQ